MDENSARAFLLISEQYKTPLYLSRNLFYHFEQYTQPAQDIFKTS